MVSHFTFFPFTVNSVGIGNALLVETATNLSMPDQFKIKTMKSIVKVLTVMDEI